MQNTSGTLALSLGHSPGWSSAETQFPWQVGPQQLIQVCAVLFHLWGSQLGTLALPIPCLVAAATLQPCCEPAQAFLPLHRSLILNSTSARRRPLAHSAEGAMLLYSLPCPFVFPAAPGFSLEISHSHMEPASLPGADGAQSPMVRLWARNPQSHLAHLRPEGSCRCTIANSLKSAFQYKQGSSGFSETLWGFFLFIVGVRSSTPSSGFLTLKEIPSFLSWSVDAVVLPCSLG